MSATPHDDQVRAAVRESAAVMQRLTGPLGGPVVHVDNWPKWLRDALVRHNDAARRGGTACPHVGPAPAPRFVALWSPGRVVCGRCASRGALQTINFVESWTCDRCRRYQPGRVALCAARSGMFVVLCGLCRTCRPRLLETGQ